MLLNSASLLWLPGIETMTPGSAAESFFSGNPEATAAAAAPGHDMKAAELPRCRRQKVTDSRSQRERGANPGGDYSSSKRDSLRTCSLSLSLLHSIFTSGLEISIIPVAF